MSRESLDILLARATDPASPYWSFWQLEGVDPSVEQLVEARLNLQPCAAQTFSGAVGWTVHQVDADGTVFLRRRQQLDYNAVQGLIAEMITFAHNYEGQFWSWMHGDGLGR